MTILDKIKIQDMRNQRPDKQPAISFSERDTGEISGYGLSMQNQYRMQIAVGVEFWANQAQYNDAKKRAEKVLLHTLHGDILARLDCAISAIYNRDEQEALMHICSIRDELVK